MIAFQNDERLRFDQQRRRMLSLVRNGDANSLSRFAREFRQFEACEWQQISRLEVSLQCMRFALIRAEVAR